MTIELTLETTAASLMQADTCAAIPSKHESWQASAYLPASQSVNHDDTRFGGRPATRERSLM